LILHALGDVALAQHEWERAQEYYREALQYALEMGEKRRAAFCLEGFAAARSPTGDAEQAAALISAADALRREIGIPVYASEREGYERILAQVRANLSSDAFARAWRDGQTMTMQQAIELAMETG
jgi:hypothetical protein